MLILGAIFFIIGIASREGAGIILALLMGGGLIGMGISRFISVKKSRELNIGEQAIYESLLRTSNNKYVELLKKAYGKERTYKPIPNRFEIIEEYKKYSTEDIHKRFEDQFLKLLNIIGEEDKETELKKAKSSSSYVDGGALVAGVMAVHSAIVGAKQNQELEKKNNSEKKSVDEKGDTVEQNDTLDEKLLKDAEKMQQKEVETINNQNKATKVKTSENVDKNKLLELKELFDEGLITEEEYNEKRKKILEKL